MPERPSAQSPEHSRPTVEATPELRPRFDLSTIAGLKVDHLELPQQAIDMAEAYLGMLRKNRTNKEEYAELAYAFRLQLREDLKEGEKAERAERIKDDLNHSFSLAIYRKLLSDPLVQETLQKELARHEQEKNEINGTYEEFKRIESQLTSTRDDLISLLSQMFKRAGQDPQPVHLAQRALLESQIANFEDELHALKQKKPDVAALIEYDTIKEYATQLRTTGFVWTKSRKKLLEDVLTGALTSRPVAALMGETGSGKTALARAASIELSNREPERTVGGDSDKFVRLLASPAIEQGKTYYEYGPLLRAMTGKSSSIDTNPSKGGGIFFDDEFNTRPTSVQRQILKFVAEARPGRKVAVPGTPLIVEVEPGFLYLAAGNPPSERYDREETGIETKREFAGNVINVEYLEQTPDSPELFQVLLASMLDQQTGRLTAITKEETAPEWMKDPATGESHLDDDPKRGGYLFRFSQCWGELYKAFLGKDTVLNQKYPADPKAKWHLPTFILDAGVVLSWIGQYKADPKARREPIALFFHKKLSTYLSQFPQDEQQTVQEYFEHFNILGTSLNLGEVNKPHVSILTPKDIGYLNPNVPRPREKGQPPKFETKDFIDLETGDVSFLYVERQLKDGWPSGSRLKRKDMAPATLPKKGTFIGFMYDDLGKLTDMHNAILVDEQDDASLHEPETLLDFYDLDVPPPPSTPDTGTPFAYDKVKAQEYGFSELKIERHEAAQRIIDAVYARDPAYVTLHKAGTPDPDSTKHPQEILTQDKYKVNETKLKTDWNVNCHDLPNIPEKSLLYFQAIADHRLSNTIDSDDEDNLYSPTVPHIPKFGQDCFMLAMDFKEFDYNNDAEKQAALTPQTKKILRTLFNTEEPTQISRDEVNTVLWSDHDRRVQSDKAKAIIHELLPPGHNPDDYELRLMHFDEYTRAAQTQNYGKTVFWTHFDGYAVSSDGYRNGLDGGDYAFGGAAYFNYGLRDDRYDNLGVRIVLSRRETPPPPEAAGLKEALDILGHDNVLGPESVKATWGRDLAPHEIPPIPYTREQLEGACAMDMMLVLRTDKDAQGNPLTGKRMKEIIEPKLTAQNKGKLLHQIDLYKNESFYTDQPPKLQWKLVTRDLIANSFSLDYTDQTKLLRDALANQPDLTQEEKDAIAQADDATLLRLETAASSDDLTIWKPAAQELANLLINKNHRRTFADTIFDHISLLQTNGSRLFGGHNLYDWTSDVTDGYLVMLGHPDSGGVVVDEWYPWSQAGNLGVSLSR